MAFSVVFINLQVVFCLWKNHRFINQFQRDRGDHHICREFPLIALFAGYLIIFLCVPLKCTLQLLLLLPLHISFKFNYCGRVWKTIKFNRRRRRLLAHTGEEREREGINNNWGAFMEPIVTITSNLECEMRLWSFNYYFPMKVQLNYSIYSLKIVIAAWSSGQEEVEEKEGEKWKSPSNGQVINCNT